MAKESKVPIRLLTSFGGEFAGHDSPSIGTVIEVDSSLAHSMIEDGRAEPTKETNSKGPKESTSSSPAPAETASTSPRKSPAVETR